VKYHREEKLGTLCPDAEAILLEHLANLAGVEQLERPGVSLDPFLQGKKAVGDKVYATARWVIHQNRAARHPAELAE
jgi:hypothetical protein